ncbi:MAG: GH92 family glycosyl hydrolase [Lachnospiraceae bacterium]|nr:GH92 family glycosyl hydrolase [Lachnospiraceae bacterium]
MVKAKTKKLLSLALVGALVVPNGVPGAKEAKAMMIDETYPKTMLWSTSFEDDAGFKESKADETEGRETVNVSHGERYKITGLLTNQIGEYTASPAYVANESYNNLFDDNAKTKYLTTANNPTVTFKLKNNTKETIKSYFITSANDAPDRDPKAWVLKGRNSDDEEWAVIDEQTNQEFKDRYERKIYNVANNDKAYNQYQLVITENKAGPTTNGKMTQFADITLSTVAIVRSNGDPGMSSKIVGGPKTTWNQKENVGWSGSKSLEMNGIHNGKEAAQGYNVIYEDLNVPVEENTNLRYVIFPNLANGDKYDYEFTSMHACVDLKFTDGTYLSDLAAVDQNGNKLNAKDQGECRTLLTKQWNEVYSNIGKVAAGKTIDKVLVDYNMASHEDIEFDEFYTYFDDIQIYNQDTPVYSHLSDYVNILRGTNGTSSFSTGLAAPAVDVPNGFNFWTPANNYNSNTIYEYQKTDSFKYMQVSHEPSIWVGDRGTWQFMVNTSLNSSTTADYSLDKLNGVYSHENEVAKAHYYKIAFGSDGRDAANSTMELTPTSHAAVVRFTFGENANNKSVIFQCVDGNTSKTESYDGKIFKAISDDKSNGSKRMYIYGEFSETPTGTKISGNHSIASFDKNVVTMKVATSYISYDQAKKNLELEVGNDDFDTVKEKAQKTWDDQLGVISGVKGASYEQLVTLYSCLYRMYSYPNIMSENTGTNESPVWKYKSPYRADDAEPVEGKIYINNGFWDTYRTAWEAYTLLTPTKSTEYLNGLVQHYKDQGWVPRWIAPGGTNSMVGTSSDIIFADAMNKGIEFDHKDAYDSALRNASSLSGNLTNGGRKDLNKSAFLGYTPGGGESFSWSMEGYINDYGIAVMAKNFADKATDETEKANYLSAYQYYLNRAKNYSLLFSDEGKTINDKWFKGRTEGGGLTNGNNVDGKFSPFFWGSDYTETNAFNMSVSVPQDGIGLANLYGGREALADKIDTIFETDGGYYGYGASNGVGGIHEQREAREVKLGQYGHSNQPSHHIPYMYLYSSRPWSTQKYVRDVLDRCYMGGTFGQGCLGDEDNGEMSAWYVLSAIGFYPLSLGTDQFAIGSPLFDEVTVNLENNKKLIIKANNNSRENVYIDSMYVNGTKYDKSFIKYETLENGGTIIFNMSNTPNENRGSSTEELETITTKDNKPQVYKDFTKKASKVEVDGILKGNSVNLYDNDSSTRTNLNDEASITFTFDDPKAVRMLTVTNASTMNAPDKVELFADNGDDKWELLGSFDDKGKLDFRGWNQFTRPFAISADKVAKYTRYKVAFTGEDDYLSEIELLGYEGEEVLKSDLKKAIDAAKEALKNAEDNEQTKALKAFKEAAEAVYNNAVATDDELKQAFQDIDAIVNVELDKPAPKKEIKLEAENFDACSSDIANDGKNIGGVRNNSWIRLDYVSFADTVNHVEFSFAAQRRDAGGYAEIYLDDKEGTPVGTVELPITGDDWSTYKTAEADLTQPVGGVHNVYIVFKNDGTHTYVANVDSMTFTSKGSEEPGENPGEDPTVSPSPTPTVTPGATVKPTPTPAVVPAKGVITKLTNVKGRKVVIKFKKLSNVKKYQIRYALKSNMKKAKVKSVSAKKQSYTVKGLKKKKTYYFQVRAQGTSGKYGNWSAKKRIKIKK